MKRDNKSENIKRDEYDFETNNSNSKYPQIDKITENVPAIKRETTEKSSDADGTEETYDTDEVEEEIDVYLNNINESSLNYIDTYLIQYPLRPKYRPYSYTSTLENIYYNNNYNKYSKVKNKPEQMEESFIFEYKLHGYVTEKIHKTNFLIREININKEAKQYADFFNPNVGKLISSSVTCDYVSSCVGFFKYNKEKQKREIYLIPMKNIYQFKPSFESIGKELKDKFENVIAQENAYHHTTYSSEVKKGYDKKESPHLFKDNEDTEDKSVVRTDREFREHEIYNKSKWEKIYNIYDADSVEAHELVSLFSTIVDKNQIMNFQKTPNKNEEENQKRDDDSYMKFNSDITTYLNTICKDTEETELCLNNNTHEESGTLKNSMTINSGHDFVKSDEKENLQVGTNKNEDIIYGNINRFYFFSLPLNGQVLQIMRIKNVQTLEEIKRMIKFNETNEVLIETLKTYCVNILGAWVIKSKYLYKFHNEKVAKKESNSHEHFTFIDYKILVRNLLIGLIYKQVEPIIIQFIEMEKQKIKKEMFAKNKERGYGISGGGISNDTFLMKKINYTNSILIENFEKATNLPNHIILDIFTPLCEYKNTGYYYKYWIDEFFLKKYIKLCLIYQQKWKNKLTKIAKLIQQYKSKSNIINDLPIDKITIEKHIIYILQNNCFTFSTIYEKVKKELKISQIDLETFKNALENVAININNMWCLNILQENEIYKCRNAVIQIYQQNYNLVLTKAELIKEVEKLMQSPLSIPDIYFRSILKEFCVQSDGRYLFKGNDDMAEI